MANRIEKKMNDLPFAGLDWLELHDLFETGSVKLKNIINDSKLLSHIKQLIPYFQPIMLGSNYYVDGWFNSNTEKLHTKFSVLNIRSLNCEHKEIIAYLQLLDLKFDCICLTEVWKTNFNQSLKITYRFLLSHRHRCGWSSYVCKHMITTYAKEKNLRFRSLQKLKWNTWC